MIQCKYILKTVFLLHDKIYILLDYSLSVFIYEIWKWGDFRSIKILSVFCSNYTILLLTENKTCPFRWFITDECPENNIMGIHKEK